jgi:hypothetical protein
MLQWADKPEPLSFWRHLIANKIPSREQFHKLCALGVLNEVSKHMKLKKKRKIFTLELIL